MRATQACRAAALVLCVAALSAAARETAVREAASAAASEKTLGVAASGSLDLRRILSDVVEALQGAGPAGFVGFLVAFSVWVCLALPTVPIEVAAGFLYGKAWGPLCGIICKTTGSCAAFMIARLLGQRWKWKVPDAISSKLTLLKSRPLLTMVGIRLAPLPLGLKNYGLALSEVGLANFMLASIIVNSPFALLWGYVGASCQTLAEAIHFNSSQASDKLGALSLVLRPEVLGVATLVLAGAAASLRLRRSAPREEEGKEQ
mmetsp:Transcript_49452/g.130690  ORF Transcript_49452/g.130690 Transcript_49452/m.130690 type:complete len:261 (+) Transcript_49452:77-859(+)